MKDRLLINAAPMKAAHRKSKERALRTVLIVTVSIAVVAVALIILFPLLWFVLGAFKNKREIFALPNRILPAVFNWDNFTAVFQLRDINFLMTLGMTFLVAGCAVILSLFINMLAAYAFSRIEFPGKRFLFGLIMLSMFIPGITILLSSLYVVSKMGIMDTFWVLLIPGLASAYNIFFFRQFFFGLPTSLEEAAILDGSGHFGIFFRIFIPLSLTPMIIIGISVFMGYWNSYLWPTLTIIRNTDLRQIMQIIKILSGSKASDFGVVIAATLMSLGIPILLYAFFQRYIVQGIAISGIK